MIGGYAVSLQGHPRATKDLDLWLESSPENIESACQALVDFVAPAHVVESLRSIRAGEVVFLGVEPFRIDLMTWIPGGDFDAAWARRERREWGEQPVWVISRADLIRAKRAAGAPQDIADAAILEMLED